MVVTGTLAEEEIAKIKAKMPSLKDWRNRSILPSWSHRIYRSKFTALCHPKCGHFGEVGPHDAAPEGSIAFDFGEFYCVACQNVFAIYRPTSAQALARNEASTHKAEDIVL